MDMPKHSALGAIVCAFLAFAPAVDAEDAPPAPDSDLVPISRAEPQFPRAALVNGITGWVRVHGTVLTDGSVADVRVVESKPPKMFDSSAMRAVSKWRFKPRIVDGVAVEREFEQTITFNFQGSETNELVAFAARHRDKLAAFHAHLRAFCPDRYSHADDAANAALRLKLAPPFRDSLMAVEPKHQATTDAWVIVETAPCLFTSWEQLRDPSAYETAAYFIAFGVAFDTPSSSAGAFKSVAAGLRAAPATPPLDEAHQFEVRKWLFRRLIPAYYGLVNAQAVQYPPAKATGAAAVDALDRANAAMDLRKGNEARSILTKALKTTSEPIDRTLLMLSLARTQTALQTPEAALESLNEATAMTDLPWNLVMTAEMARATLCGRIGNAGCFEASRAKLHAELGLTDKFVY
jgi:TonB family protein